MVPGPEVTEHTQGPRETQLGPCVLCSVFLMLEAGDRCQGRDSRVMWMPQPGHWPSAPEGHRVPHCTALSERSKDKGQGWGSGHLVRSDQWWG